MFTLVSLSGLALAIGLNTAVFSVLEAIYWRPLPVKDGDRVVRILRIDRDDRAGAPYSEAELRHYRESAALEDFTGVAIDDRLIAEWPQASAPRAIAAFVAPGFFSMLGGHVVAGRLLQADEADTSALITESAWRRRLSGNSDVVGAKLIVNGLAFTIAGVVADKSLAIAGRSVDIVLPLRSADPLRLPEEKKRLWLLGKLRQGTHIEEAQAALAITSRRWFAAHPEETKVYRPLLVPARLGSDSWRDIQGTVVLLSVAVLLVLLVACANLTNLLLARAEARQREMAVRLSLGASRLRVIRQLLTECFLLTAAAGILGMTCANAVLRAALLMLPRLLPMEFTVPWLDIGVNGTVFLYAFSLCALTAFFFGLVPAKEATRADFASAMKHQASTVRSLGGHLRKLLIAGQMAACMVLLIVTASLNRVMSVLDDSLSALDAKPVVQAELHLAAYGYTPAAAHDFVERARQRLAALPEVEATGFTPFRLVDGQGSGAASELQIEGQEARLPAPGRMGFVSDDVLRVFGLHLTSGRDFTGAESRDGAPVALINEPMARDLWPRSNPLGRHIRFWSKGQPGPWWEVVGVVAEKAVATEGTNGHSFLRPIGGVIGRGYLQVRARTAPGGVMLAVRRVIGELDPRIASNVTSAQAMIDFARLGPRLIAAGASVVALASLFMAAIGLYGVTAYLASRRTKEIGIRMALGARPRDVVWMIVRQGSVLVAVGLLIGLLLAGATEHTLSATLRLLPSSPILTYVAIATFLTVVALLAMVVPSLGAARVNPVAALRQDG